MTVVIILSIARTIANFSADNRGWQQHIVLTPELIDSTCALAVLTAMVRYHPETNDPAEETYELFVLVKLPSEECGLLARGDHVFIPQNPG